MELSNLLTDEATVTKTYGDDTLTVTYRPSGITGDLLAGIRDRAVAANDAVLPEADAAEMLAEVLAAILVGWDLVDGGEPVGTDADSLNTLPLSFLSEINELIQTDVNESGKAKRATSVGGSRPVASTSRTKGGTPRKSGR